MPIQGKADGTATAKPKPSVDEIPKEEVMDLRPRLDWPEIQRYYDAGHTIRQCCEKFGFSIAAWYKARNRGSLQMLNLQSRCNRRYDWVQVKAYYDEGHSIRECYAKFGFCAGSWVARSKHRSSIKRRLLKEGHLENRCGRCGISIWCGKPISIQIDHINGVNDDYRLENLRMLCPNCHSLTETHGARNRGKGT